MCKKKVSRRWGLMRKVIEVIRRSCTRDKLYQHKIVRTCSMSTKMSYTDHSLIDEDCFLFIYLFILRSPLTLLWWRLIRENKSLDLSPLFTCRRIDNVYGVGRPTSQFWRNSYSFINPDLHTTGDQKVWFRVETGSTQKLHGLFHEK